MRSQTPELDLFEAPGGLCRSPPSLYPWAFSLIFFPGFSIALSITVRGELRPPRPAACPPCEQPQPVIWGCELKGLAEKKRKRKKWRDRQRERKYFESCSWCSFTGRASLSLAFDLYKKNFPGEKKPKKTRTHRLELFRVGFFPHHTNLIQGEFKFSIFLCYPFTRQKPSLSHIVLLGSLFKPGSVFLHF